MFDIGFWELILISVVALIVLGPERLPAAIRTVSQFIQSARNIMNTVKAEISHELRVQELHADLKKAEEMNLKNLSPDLKESVDKLKAAAQSVNRPYQSSEASPSTSKNERAEPPEKTNTIETENK